MTEGGTVESSTSFGDGLAAEARLIIADARQALADPKLSDPEAVHDRRARRAVGARCAQRPWQERPAVFGDVDRDDPQTHDRYS